MRTLGINRRLGADLNHSLAAASDEFFERGSSAHCATGLRKNAVLKRY